MKTKRRFTPWLLAAGMLLLLVGTWTLQHTLKLKPVGSHNPSQGKRPQRLGPTAQERTPVIHAVPGLTA